MYFTGLLTLLFTVTTSAAHIARNSSFPHPSLNCDNLKVKDALDWLISQQGSSGLVLSFISSESWTLDRGYAYDNAVAAISLMLNSDHSESEYLMAAEDILTGLENGLHTDATDPSLRMVPFYFDIDTNTGAGAYRTGTAAWVAEAFALHWLITGQDTYSSSLQGITQWMLLMLNATGTKNCIQGGPDVTWCSTEHMIDSYFVFHLTNYLTNNSEYLHAAEVIAASLYDSEFWNDSNGRFNQGYQDPYMALDTQSWGSVWLLSNGINGTLGQMRADDALTFADSYFLSYQMSILGGMAKGYGPYADSSNGFHSEAVWSEGSLGVALAHLRKGDTAYAKMIVEDLMSLIGTDGSLLYVANKTTVDVSGETFYPFPSAAGTAWLGLTCSSTQSVFWNADEKMYNEVKGSYLSFNDYRNHTSNTTEINYGFDYEAYDTLALPRLVAFRQTKKRSIGVKDCMVLSQNKFSHKTIYADSGVILMPTVMEGGYMSGHIALRIGNARTNLMATQTNISFYFGDDDVSVTYTRRLGSNIPYVTLSDTTNVNGVPTELHGGFNVAFFHAGIELQEGNWDIITGPTTVDVKWQFDLNKAMDASGNSYFYPYQDYAMEFLVVRSRPRANGTIKRRDKECVRVTGLNIVDSTTSYY